MYIKEHDKDQAIFIKHNSWQSKEKTHMYGPHQSLIYLTWIRLTNSIILELWKIHYCLFKIKRNRKLFENRRKFVQVHAKMRMVASLLKSRFLVPKTLMNDKNWGLKIILKKTRVELKLFENLKFWRSNVKIGVLKIKFENWNFEN